MTTFTALVSLPAAFHAWLLLCDALMTRAWAKIVAPADVLAALRADAAAAEWEALPIELVDAIADRLGVEERDGRLICPGCQHGDYAPLDTWPRLMVLYRLTRHTPAVVRAVCMDCGTASRATTDHVDHYIPEQEGQTP